MRSPSTKPFPGVFIPPEAEPYCDSRGIIDWAKVAAKLGLDRNRFWGHRLPSILKGIQDDDTGILQGMRALKLDRVTNSIMASGRRGSTDISHRRAIKFASDFDIPLDQVIGSGPDGLILKRDVVAFHRGIKMQNISFEQRSAKADSRHLRQRRILAQHLRDLLRTNRSLCAILASTQDRLAATSTKLGEALRDKLALEARLQMERETSARLDSVVRRLAARPRIKRTTTHVEIAGLVFRNRTTKAVAA